MKKNKLVHLHIISDGEISTHYHQSPELFYVLSGQLIISIDDTKFCLRRGDMILVNANKSHTVIGSEALLAGRFEIDFHMLAEMIGSMQLLFWCNSVAEKNDAYAQVRVILDRIIARYFDYMGEDDFLTESLYYELMHLVTTRFLLKKDRMNVNFSQTPETLRIKEIQNYIQANYQSQISLNDLADRLFLSNAYLSKYIKKQLGMTFVEYLNNIRVFHAVDELLYSQKNITHIALDNGFPTSAAFTKLFRKMYGTSPSEYRSKYLKELAHQQENTELSPDILRRFAELRIRDRQKQESVTEINADIKEICQLKRDTSTSICVGEVYCLLQQDVQSQLKDIARNTGLKSVRIWNVFSDPDCYDGKERLNFRKLDIAIDFLLENGLRPHIDLGEKHTDFLYSPEKSLKSSHHCVMTEKNLEFLIRNLCVHLINRYGIDEVEKWNFELWNNALSIDPHRRAKWENTAYIACFDKVYQILKKLSPAIRLGGAGFVLGYENYECKQYIQLWAKREIKPDFISLYSYQYVAFEEEGLRYGRKSLDYEYMRNQVGEIKKLLWESGMENTGVQITEWNFTISNRNVLNDSCNHGAFVMKSLINMNGEVDGMSYWHALDSYSEYFDSESPLNGDSGLITRNGIHKPSYYAMVFFHRLHRTIIQAGSNSMISTNGKDQTFIVCHNYKTPAYKFVNEDEQEMKYEHMRQYLEEDTTRSLRFTIHGLRAGVYDVKHQYINDTKGDVIGIWRRLGFRKNLTRDEMEYFSRSALPWLETETIDIDGDSMELEVTLEPGEFRQIAIAYRYAL